MASCSGLACAFVLGGVVACARPAVSAESAPEDAAEVETGGEPETGEPEGDSIFLSVLDADVRPRALELVNEAQDDAQFARHLRVRVHVMRAYRDVGELSRRTKTRAVNGIFQLTDLTQLSSSDRPRPSDKQSSFVVDFDEPALREPADELHREDPAISARAVAAFVDRYIAKKTYTHGFDVASRVADSRAGDCTEHAVLTAALLRRFDHPARLVFGIALVGLANPGGRTRILAAGHAWVEEYDGSSWRIVDAALNPGGGTRARTGVPGLPEGGHIVLAYLPITVMRDETPGFSRALMDEAGVDAVVGLELDAVPDEALPTDAAPSDAH